jgi:multidrug transporter EmrE-like cation transporter
MGYLYIAMTVILTVYGQLILKWQVDRIGNPSGGMEAKLSFFAQALTNPWVLSGLGAAFAASLCWMLALTRLPLSTAYPYTATAFVLVVFAGAWIFSEPLTPQKVLGVFLIVAGLTVGGLK